MKAENFTFGAVIPSAAEFADRFPHYGVFAKGVGHKLFKKIMSPETAIFIQVVTIAVELPAVTGIADFCFDFVNGCEEIEWNAFTKQFVGAAVGFLMEVNGYERMGRKKTRRTSIKSGGMYSKVTT